MTHGPDAARYILAGRGEKVARPFNLRWLLPAICGDDQQTWWLVWLASWPVTAAAAFWWASAYVDGWQVPAATVALLLLLPVVQSHPKFRPVAVDPPALAVTLTAAAFWANGYEPIAIVLAFWAATIKETQPVWLALWVWSPWPLVALAAPAIAWFVNRPGMDPITAQTTNRFVHDHPVRSALHFHQGVWRTGWVMVAPWGACLAALYAPSWQLAAVLAAAYAQLLVATDSVRLYQFAAGPVVALAAAQAIPVEWLPLAIIVGSYAWWRQPEVV